ncbi:MAG TPA: hypothetical protein VK524_03915 [Polyangiaceae bacterium]|nr:hypothetical protein [Polyangiaceae bacterium]
MKLLSSLVCLLLAASACNKETKPTAEQSPASIAKAAEGTPAPTESAAREQATAAQSEYKEPNFELSIVPAGDIKAGQANRAEITLVAKEPFHVNQSYPYKFKAGDSQGVKPEKPVTSSEAVKLEQKRVLMNVGFTADKPGKGTLSGQFSFSVCTEDKCLIEKRNLSLDMNVL